jgi:hypothetical protein
LCRAFAKYGSVDHAQHGDVPPDFKRCQVELHQCFEVTDSQLHLLTEILNEQKATFKENPESAKKLCPSIKGEDINQVKTAALTVTCQAIYNTDAAIWKR